MPFLRQSTAQTIRFGPCLDKTDGVTEETALTLAQADMRLSKDGGAFAQKSAAGNATHDSDGWYSTSLSTTDTSTVGELRLNVHQPANMLPVWDRWWVLEEAVYDAMFSASAAGPLQPTTAGRTLDVAASGEAGLDLGNVTGVLGNANVGWIDGNNRVDVGSFLGTAVAAATASGEVAANVMEWLGTAVGAATAGMPNVNVEEINNNVLAVHTLRDWLAQGIRLTADSGTTTTLVDVGLSQGDTHWEDALLVFRTGTNSGRTAIVTDFDAASDTITFTPAVPNAVTAGMGFALIPGLGRADMVKIAKAIWDRVLTGATHNISSSAGRRLRQIEASFVITAGTAQAGTANTITLAAGESASDEIFAGDRVVITGGTGVGEHGIVTTYNGTSKVCTMSQNWVVTPDATSEYELSPADVDIESWQHAIVGVSPTTGLPEVDTKSISDDATAADNLELFTEGTALGTLPKVNTEEINAAEVVGDGNATPWDGA